MYTLASSIYWIYASSIHKVQIKIACPLIHYIVQDGVPLDQYNVGQVCHSDPKEMLYRMFKCVSPISIIKYNIKKNILYHESI